MSCVHQLLDVIHHDFNLGNVEPARAIRLSVVLAFTPMEDHWDAGLRQMLPVDKRVRPRAVAGGHELILVEQSVWHPQQGRMGSVIVDQLREHSGIIAACVRMPLDILGVEWAQDQPLQKRHRKPVLLSRVAVDNRPELFRVSGDDQLIPRAKQRSHGRKGLRFESLTAFIEADGREVPTRNTKIVELCGSGKSRDHDSVSQHLVQRRRSEALVRA